MTSLLLLTVSFTLTPLLLFAFISIITSAQRTNLPTRLRDFYASLRTAPRLPPNATLSDRFRHACHRVYFRYLITGPGYALEPAERIVFDGFVAVLLGATVWCVSLFCPLGGGLVQARWLNGMERCFVRIVRDEMARWVGIPTTGLARAEVWALMILGAHAYWG